MARLQILGRKVEIVASDSIVIKGAREHNLKNVDVTIPRDKLVVITGLSGSGKSSLAFDTIYAEGQRRYVESLSAYARQFLGQMNKPDLDSIDGLSPRWRLTRKTTSKIRVQRLALRRKSTTTCVFCSRAWARRIVLNVGAKSRLAPPTATDEILALGEGKSAHLGARRGRAQGRAHENSFLDLQKRRLRACVSTAWCSVWKASPSSSTRVRYTIDVVVDRVVLEGLRRAALPNRLKRRRSFPTVAWCAIWLMKRPKKPTAEIDSGLHDGMAGRPFLFACPFACPEHGHSMDELQPRDFSFNAPYGACPDCAGLGSREEVDPSLLIPDPSLSLNEGCIAPFATGNYYPQVLRAVCKHMGEDPATPWEDLKKKTRDVLLYGLKSEKVFVDYVTVDGRETGWSIDWEGACEAVMGRYKDSTSDSQREKIREVFRYHSMRVMRRKAPEARDSRRDCWRQEYPRSVRYVGRRCAGVLQQFSSLTSARRSSPRLSERGACAPAVLGRCGS